MKKWAVFTIVIILAIASGFIIWSQKNKCTNNVVPTVTVQKGTIVEKAQAIGYIEPLYSNTVKSSVGGTVAKIYHYEGEYVPKGELLLEVNPEPEPADYATTYANLQEAIHTEESQKKNLARYEEALKKGLITANYTDYINAQKRL